MKLYLGNIVSAVWRPETYKHLAYQFVGGLIGLIYFSVPATLVAFGVAPAIIWAVAPLLVVASGFSGHLRELERRLANRMLGTVISPVRTRIAQATSAQRLNQRARQLLTDAIVWRLVLWLVFRALFGLLVLTLVALFLLTIVQLLLLFFASNFPSSYGQLFAGFSIGVLFILVMSLVVTNVTNLFTDFHRSLAEDLLGPPTTEQLAALHKRNEQLSERARLAHELHDSLGHGLTVVVTQAAIAQKRLDNDTDVHEALRLIEDTGRASLFELDQMLAVLVDGLEAQANRHGVGELDQLLNRIRAVGLPVTSSVSGNLSVVPTHTGNEAYYIIQEGLTNVLRQAGIVRTWVDVTVRTETLEVTVTNEQPQTNSALNTLGGRRGLRDIIDRTNALGGLFEVGPTSEGGYRLHAVLPMNS